MEYKYTLIVSQYYHSRHFFIVHHTEDFLKRAKAFANELMVYKRYEGDARELYAGDIDYDKSKEIRTRYNINDAGDIYFIQSNYSNYLASETRKYQEDSIRESRGYQTKKITNEISEHHDYGQVALIVEKHFEIA